MAGNVNLALVRQCLGHKDIGSTMRYVGTSDAQASEAAPAALMRLSEDATESTFCCVPTQVTHYPSTT